MNKYIKLTIPVLFGYLPVGMAFGILLSNAGYGWPYSLLFSLFVYAGAAQFMALSLLAAKATMVDVAISTFLINFRHLFYGLSLLNEVKGGIQKNLYFIFGLTDETYSLVTSGLANKSIEALDFKKINIMNHLYWISGCLLGSLFGEVVDLNIKGLEFILTALFVVLSYEQFKIHKAVFPLIFALFFSILFFIIIPKMALLISIFMSLLFLLGKYRRDQHE